MRQLVERGVQLRLGTTVNDASGGAVRLSSGEVIPCRTLVWTAGVRSHPSVVSLGLPADERGRARVDATMAVDGMPGVWSLGDAAAVPDPAPRDVREPGQDQGRGEHMGVHFAGLPAWLVTRTYHLSRIPGLRRKARVAADWTIGLLFRRDTSELGSLGHPKRLGK